MKIFLDTADINEINELSESGLIDGVTTNPSLASKSDKSFIDLIKEISSVIQGPISAEVTAENLTQMIKEADKLRKIADNIAIKVPLTVDGLKCCKKLSNDGTMVNVTLCFSANQALLAAKCGATFISPFVGRLDDIGIDGIDLISDILDIYDNYGFETQVLAASIRHPLHVLQVAKVGADVATLPPKIIKQLYDHPLTNKGLESFLSDWKKSGKKIT
ncbi:MAG: fructose-6-phosphate aldolase [Alphaproteobacteria bacterium TMED87]|nr:fructose-6-phosphate aldolase [Rhodospirillaceae bacterium]OUV10520.1 MAG: fructose-6-phosphate aldolase [Alphaproteobacteria bacterium TMED87]|tara:strand:- start:130 stop:783 length:654 start_codon:yes stop_codon:yes gene_type:complete